jgi:hypothetical protein
MYGGPLFVTCVALHGYVWGPFASHCATLHRYVWGLVFLCLTLCNTARVCQRLVSPWLVRSSGVRCCFSGVREPQHVARDRHFYLLLRPFVCPCFYCPCQAIFNCFTLEEHTKMKRMSGRYAALATPGGRGTAATWQPDGSQRPAPAMHCACCCCRLHVPLLHSLPPSLCACVCACAGAPLVPKSMGADEFLPIHMFVLVNARLENPQLLSRQLQQLCDESTIQVCSRRFNARACMVRLCIGL